MVITLSLILGTLLPAVVGYIVGSRAVKSRSELRHHFTGVLFGLLAFWIVMLMTVSISLFDSMRLDHNLGMLVVNIVPSIVIAVITTIIAVSHVRSRYAAQDLIRYKPYGIVLMASVLAIQLWPLIQALMSGEISFFSFVAPALLVVLIVASYMSLHAARQMIYEKLIWSTVSV